MTKHFLTLALLSSLLLGASTGCGDDAGGDPDGGPPPPVDAGPDCVTDPVTNDDFLNACTDNTCAPFDNEARLPLLGPNGELPPIGG